MAIDQNQKYALKGYQVEDIVEGIKDNAQKIEELKNSPDVVDIVDTYADLQEYDTSKLGDNDIVRVLKDETHDGDSSYYQWNKTSETWIFIGAISAATKTTFYASSSETGVTRHIYKDATFTNAASVQDIYDASEEGLVTLKVHNINTPTQFNEVILANVWQSPSDDDYQFIFIGDGTAYTYGADALTDDLFYYHGASFLFGNRVQTTGSSTTDIMSQKAVTDSLVPKVEITMTTTDPGEGVTLAEHHLIGVYTAS